MDGDLALRMLNVVRCQSLICSGCFEPPVARQMCSLDPCCCKSCGLLEWLVFLNISVSMLLRSPLDLRLISVSAVTAGIANSTLEKFGFRHHFLEPTVLIAGNQR